jgi:SAM-dependent methyltransferase
MVNAKLIEPRTLLKNIVKVIRKENIQLLINVLKKEAQTDDELKGLIEQLESAKSSPALLRELFRRWVIDPKGKYNPHGVAARRFFGWHTDAGDFNKLRPEFLDVIYLLPPRDYAIIETLVPLLEYRSNLPLPQTGSQGTKKLFDVGTGTGLLMQILRRVGVNGKMVGIDPATALADYACTKFEEEPDVEITTPKIQEFKGFDLQFQMALCYMVLHHVPKDNGDIQYEKALEKIYGALAEGGIFVYTDKLCAGRSKVGKPKAFDFKTTSDLFPLQSGQDLTVQPAELNSIPPFQPHPQELEEYNREWKEEAAETLSKIGFLIQSAKPLNERVVLFVCRKPYTNIWDKFAHKPNPKFHKALSEKDMAEIEKHAPYQWSYKVLEAIYQDLSREKEVPKTGEVGKGFLKGIAYFSWEKASRLFLVRRAYPFGFHILSYSHVHEGWGSLGRMLEEFEENTQKYVEKTGYSCLTRDAVQRTLPFQGDIEYLNYEAAMAVPVYKLDPINGYQLRGAFLFYLAKPEYVPLHTGSPWQDDLIKKFKDLNDVMNNALNKQENKLQIENSTQVLLEQWETLAAKKPGAVIARLEINLAQKKGRNSSFLKLLKVSSKIQAQLSGSECYSVLDDSELEKGQVAILVAARFGTSYDEIQEKILAIVGVAAAENFGPFKYSCNPLGLKTSRKINSQLPHHDASAPSRLDKRRLPRERALK